MSKTKAQRHVEGAYRASMARLTVAEVSAILGINRGVVYRLEQRAIRKLRRHPLMRELAAEVLNTDKLPWF